MRVDWLLVGKLHMRNSLMFSLYYTLNFFANFHFVKVIQVDWLLIV